jgi:uncharacterized protein (TIGR03118 family)
MRKNDAPTVHALTIFITVFFLVAVSGCKKTYDRPAAQQGEVAGKSHSSHNLKDFKQVNLVANNNEYNAAHVDPHLLNAWGLTWAASGIAWIGAQAGHVSTVYTGEGATVLGPVNIPSPGGNEGGNPTGDVNNPNAADFVIPSGNTTAPTGARFIFVGVDGVVSGWNPSWGTHAFAKFVNPGGASYTGVTIASNGGSNFLYAANFKARRIDVWDRNWNAVSLPFHDIHIPIGFSPFNIQNVNGQLFVMYAKVGPDGRDQAGEGLGYVDIYSPAGVLVKRLVSRDELNAPWGVTMISAAFLPAVTNDNDRGDDHGDGDGHGHEKAVILIGNFGNGVINAYTADGDFVGHLRSHGRTLVIDGLWSIGFAPTTSTIDQARLYFTAGPDHEADGLFGYIIHDSTAGDDDED